MLVSAFWYRPRDHLRYTLQYMQPFVVKNELMELSCHLDEAGVIQIRMSGNLSDDHEEELQRWAAAVRAAMRYAKAQNPGRVLCLIDLTGRNIEADHTSLTVLMELMKHNRDYATRTGVYGPSYFTRSIIEIALKATGRKNLKLFSTKTAAERWVFAAKSE